MRARIQCLVGTWLTAVSVASGARATSPAVKVQATGNCPDQTQLETAVGTFTGLASPATDAKADAWLLRTAPAAGGLSVVLTSPDGKPAIDRRVASTDCSALAQAVALMVEAHFTELGILVPAIPTTPPAPTTEVPSSPRRPAAAPMSSEGWGGAIALSLGAAFDVAPFGASPAASLGVYLTPPARPWMLRLGLRTQAPAVQTSETDRVEHWPSGAEIGAGIHSSGSWWYEVALGAGAELSRVRALDLPGTPKVVRLHPDVALTLATGARISGPWSLRIAVDELLFLGVDRYVIEPLGETARSPRSAVVATAGVEVEFGGRAR